MVNPVTRERHDATWALYPYEHPAAYWLRAGAEGIVCLRCGGTSPATLDEADHEAFAAVHLACPLGFGLRDSKPRVRRARPADPLFS